MEKALLSNGERHKVIWRTHGLMEKDLMSYGGPKVRWRNLGHMED